MTAPAVVEGVYLTTLAATLETATDEQLADIASHWAALPGHIADTARHLIDEAFEYRLAVAHLTELAVTR